MEYSHGQYCDYGPVAPARFAKWLEKKYGKIAKLNQTWASEHADFAAAKAPHLDNKAKCESPDLDPAFLDFMAFREDMLKELMTQIYAAMKAADPDCQLGIQVGRTHDGPVLVAHLRPCQLIRGAAREEDVTDIARPGISSLSPAIIRRSAS